jgi:hypothetical protein
VITDIAPVVDVVQPTGQPVEVCAFIGSLPHPPVRGELGDGTMLKLSKDAVEFAVKNGLTCMFVTEDTTRAHPDDVRALYTTAIEAGAKRVCVCDTCGHATPVGTAKLIRLREEHRRRDQSDVGIDWHGHRDRGLGLANALAASRPARRACTRRPWASASARATPRWTCCSSTCACSAGSTTTCPSSATTCGSRTRRSASRSLELRRLRLRRLRDRHRRPRRRRHQGLQEGRPWLANRVYSGVPADMVGLEQVIKPSARCRASRT